MVNQAALTGESMPVKKETESYVYAGTVVEEGEITFCVKTAAGDTRFERITSMIEESEKLKSSLEGKAATLADALVPWSLGATGLTSLSLHSSGLGDRIGQQSGWTLASTHANGSPKPPACGQLTR